MRRTKLLTHLAEHGCVLLREGAKHSIYRNLRTGAQSSVPRHKEVLEYTAKKICAQLGIPKVQ